MVDRSGKDFTAPFWFLFQMNLNNLGTTRLISRPLMLDLFFINVWDLSSYFYKYNVIITNDTPGQIDKMKPNVK